MQLLLAIILMFSQVAPATTDRQDPSKEKQKAAQTGRDAVRISVTLVQLDVTITDAKGQPVTDLTAEDFEVLQNDRPQKITNFSYATLRPTISDTNASETRAAGKNATVEPPAPPPRLRADQVRRTIALVVDDLTLSFESTALVREALKKFVDQQMKPGDLVAIIRTGAGMGALQQYTNDKRQLYAAIERVRWKPGYGAINTFSPVTTDPARDVARGFDPRGDAVTTGLNNPREAQAFDLTEIFDRRTRDRDDAAQFREEVFSIGTLGALSFVVRGLSELPARKSVVLFSDELRIYNREQTITRVDNGLKNLIDLANRASVMIYTVDSRGLQTLGPTAADDLSGDIVSPTVYQERTDYSKFLAKTETGMVNRRREFFESQDGLRYLADKTGGLFIRNTNDLNRGVSRALQDQEGYYLIGFVPEESTFKSKNGSREFHNVVVKVKRPGLRVRSRSGFYGVTDKESSSRTPRGSAGQQLLTALASPFGHNDIAVRMTAQFWHDSKGGAFVNALLHIDARDLTFEETVNGWRKVVIEVAAFTFGDNGQVIDQSNRAYSVSMSDQQYRRTLESGIFYRINLPIKKAGAYQLRTAVRDQTSKKLGSANQFIEIPDLKKNKLALSGVIVRGIESPAASQPAAAPQPVASTAEGRVEEMDSQANAATRKFHRGSAAEYGYMIYNAQVDKSTGRPQLETQVRLYRDGQRVYAGKLNPFDTGGRTDFKRLIAGGSLRLGKELTPGDYALQVIVVDKLRKDKDSIVTQWIDFDIVK